MIWDISSCRNLFVAALCAVAGFASGQTATSRAESPSVKVGDRWKFETRDRRTGVKESEVARTVGSVGASRIEGSQNDGTFVATPEMNFVETPTVVLTGDVKYLSFPLEVGKKWAFKYGLVNKVSGARADWQLEAEVVAVDKTKVQAGEFETYKIEYKGFWNNRTTGRNGRFVITNWYAPMARTTVKTEFDDTYNRTTTELVEMQLQP
jgi:hypothetical protein